MLIDIKSLLSGKDKKIEATGQLIIASLKDDFQGFSCNTPVQYDLSLSLLETDKIKLSANIKAEFSGTCVRCLADATYQADVDIVEDFVALDRRNSSDMSLNEVYEYRDFKLNPTQAFKDNLLSSLPLVLLCSDTCRGLCSRCGKNLNSEICNCVQQQQEEQDQLSPFDVLSNLLDT